MEEKKAQLKRIIMIVFSYYPSDPRVRREAEALSKKGHHVEVVCLKKKEESLKEIINAVQTYRIMDGDINKENIVSYLKETIKFTIKAFKYLNNKRKKPIDIVYVHNMPDYLVFAGILQKFRKTPIVFDLHDLTPELFISKWGGGKKKYLIPAVKLVEKLACYLSVQLITTSKGFYNRLIDRGIHPNKIEIVYNSADPEYFKNIKKTEYKNNNQNPVILYHGTIAERFGIHIAIESVYLLKEQGFNPILIILGKYDDSYKIKLKELISKYKLQKNVFLKGFYPLNQITKLMEMADIGIVPYLSDPFMDLALSTKTFEYVLVRIPVIASRIESIGNIFDDTCITYFEAGNPVDLSEKIKELCKNTSNQKKKVKNALDVYKKIEWNKEKIKYINIIEKI